MTIVVAAGVYTAPNFLDEFRETLVSRLSDDTRTVNAVTAFPYGDWFRSRFAQSAEIAKDVCFGQTGGVRLARSLQGEAEPGAVALIGHSGGGVAAARAAPLLAARGWQIAAIAMIGSPRAPIPAGYGDRTLRISAVDEHGAEKDPVTRLGFWAGRAPARSVGLPIVGGHPDYFRSRPPFMNEDGRSNLDLTADVVVGWVKHRERS
ncbi:hypothetical protein MO973_18880 [Paenibacillus sp. TRM 82003]|nr:hypothetical protein [Paenibacillus sp. TRM 82003]